MLNIAIKEANEQGGTRLRDVAEALIKRAIDGDVPAIREVADRLDGKVPQAIEGSEEAPLTIELIRRVIVDAKA